MDSGLWHTTYRTSLKAIVEHIFGKIKLRNNPMNARKSNMQDKQIISRVLMYNLQLCKEGSEVSEK